MNNSHPANQQEDERRYALYAAAKLIEQTAALQNAFPGSMLDDWLDHLDHMLRASFPESLIATWRNHKLDILSYLCHPKCVRQKCQKHSELATWKSWIGRPLHGDTMTFSWAGVRQRIKMMLADSEVGAR